MLKSTRSASYLKPISIGMMGLSGVAGLTARDLLLKFVEAATDPTLSKVYASMIQNTGFGAFGLFVLGALCWGWAVDEERKVKSHWTGILLIGLVASPFVAIVFVSLSRILNILNKLAAAYTI